MLVTIEPMEATVCTTRRKISLNQKRVRVDGRFVGYMPLRPGGRLMLLGRYSPAEVDEIKRQVDELMGQAESAAPVQSPEVPDELRKELRDQQEDDATDDDFD